MALPSWLLTVPEMVRKPWAASSALTTEGDMAYCVSFMGSMCTATSSRWAPMTLILPISGMLRSLSESPLASSSSSRGDRSLLSMASSSVDALPKSSMTAVATTPCGSSVRRKSVNPSRMRDHVTFMSLSECTSVTNTYSMPFWL